MSDVIVIGAGISGLALARRLRELGRSSVVLERARGVGGRCATRRLDGQPVDHGLAFLHGRGQRFLSELGSVENATVIEGWPRVRVGEGTPCRPEAFEASTRWLAFAEGVNRFAKHLARGSDVRLNTNVEALRPKVFAGNAGEGGWELALASGEIMRARAVAMTLPAPSAIDLIQAAAPVPAELSALLPLLGLVHMSPCLTVIATYPVGTAAPAWDASFDPASGAIHTILHDSGKRVGAPRLTLVVQARPAYSRAHLDDSRESWTQALLEQAATLHGTWIVRPESVQAHVWRNARVYPGSELARPVALRLEDGQVLGFAGDGFHEVGGVEGAFLSGIEIAARFDELLACAT